MGTFNDFLKKEKRRDAELKFKAAVAAPGRLKVDLAEVDLARKEYLAYLDRLRTKAGSKDWELTDADRIEVDVFRLRSEALEELAREEQRDAESRESRELAKTNTELAKSQTRIAKAVAAFTLLQFALAVAQAFHWIRP